MSLACPLPSYGSRAVLSKSNPLQNRNLDTNYLRKLTVPLKRDEFLQIKKNAKKTFKSEYDRQQSSATCYGGTYNLKRVDEPTSARIRPSSPSRRNRPHPPRVFMVNRLQNIDGYYQPESVHRSQTASLPKRPARPESSATSSSRPFTARTSFSEREVMKKKLGAVHAQAVESWLKLASEKDRVAIRQSFKLDKKRLRNGRESVYANKTKDQLPEKSTSSKNNTLVSLSRSLRQASNERKVLEGRERFIFETPKNKDFQIHPGWSTAWHKQYDSRAVRYPTQLYA